MAQYHILVNRDRQEYVDPTKLGDGPQLMTFAEGRTAKALCVLLAWDTDPCNGGDVKSHSGVVGSWAGNTALIVGDYGTLSDECVDAEGQQHNLYEWALMTYEDISRLIDEALKEDEAFWAARTVGAPPYVPNNAMADEEPRS